MDVRCLHAASSSPSIFASPRRAKLILGRRFSSGSAGFLGRAHRGLKNPKKSLTSVNYYAMVFEWEAMGKPNAAASGNSPPHPVETRHHLYR
jgi:hypothetical protein